MEPLLRSDSSCSSSFIDSTGAQGMSNLRKMSTASYLVLSLMKFSIVAKISSMCGWRARAVV